MTRTLHILVFSLLIGNTILSQDLRKNTLGISGGYVPAISDFYIDMPFDIWPDRKPGPVLNVFYSRSLNDLFRIGSFFEYEKVNFSFPNSSDVSGSSCFDICLNWLTVFPKKPVHAQMGGYVGYGFMNAEGWDNLKGPLYGIILGPAYEFKDFGIALHFQVGRAWYESTGTPLGVMTYTPKFLLKIYYKFADF